MEKKVSLKKRKKQKKNGNKHGRNGVSRFFFFPIFFFLLGCDSQHLNGSLAAQKVAGRGTFSLSISTPRTWSASLASLASLASRRVRRRSTKSLKSAGKKKWAKPPRAAAPISATRSFLEWNPWNLWIPQNLRAGYRVPVFLDISESARNTSVPRITGVLSIPEGAGIPRIPRILGILGINVLARVPFFHGDLWNLRHH